MNASTAPSRAAEVERYIAGVSAALADLPDSVRQELLEDLPDHLAEIAADDPAALDDRLGSPEAYAAELRAATGVDVSDPGPRRDRLAETITALRPHALAFDAKVGQLIGYDRLVDFLVQLRPAWWVLRGYLVAVVMLHLLAGGYGLLPHDGSAGLIGWLLVLALVGLSIRMGRRPLHLRRRLKPMWLAAAGVALVLLGFGLAAFDNGPDDYYQPSYNGEGGYYDSSNEVYIYTDGGASITNVRVYNRNGDAVPIGVPMGCERQPDGIYRERRGCLPLDTPDDAAPPIESPEPSRSPEPGRSAEPSGSATQSGSPAPSGTPGGSPS